MEDKEIKEIKVNEKLAIKIKTNVGFFGRLVNIIINPLRYIITGKIQY